MAEQARNTIIEIKADLGCSRCYRKIKRLLCKYHQIRNQIFDEKQNTVIITVYCCSPERILHKLESKGGKTIHSIKIKEEADVKKGGDNNKKPKQEEEAVASKPPPSPKKTDATPTPDVKQKEKQNPKPTSPPPPPPVDANPILPPPPKKGDGAKKAEGPPQVEKQQQGGEGVVIQSDKKEVEDKSKKGGGGGEGVKFIMDPVAAAPGYPSQWYPNSVYIPHMVQPATYYDSYGYYYNNGGGYGRTGVCDCGGGGGGRSIFQNRCDCNFSDENPTACLIM